MKLSRRQFSRAIVLGLGAAALKPLVGSAGPDGARGSRAPRAAAAGVAAVQLDPGLPLHPSLQYGAQVEPDKWVRVIVQKTHRGASGRAVAQAGDGRDLEEFAFVKSHVMEVKQGKLLKLARHHHVLQISPDGPVQRHGSGSISASDLKTAYDYAVNAPEVWNASNGLSATGAGVTVAVIDTGVMTTHPDFGNGKGLQAVKTNPAAANNSDAHGHGTHVTGIIRGWNKAGHYIGIAPNSSIISIKIADDTGVAHASDLLRGMQWVFDNRVKHNIRVVNLSITAGIAESYRISPVAAAAEQLWFNGIAVVVAAGNRGTAADACWYAPANDPYVITVGALDDNGTGAGNDDQLAVFSSRGLTQDGYAKPDVVAPGRRIVSLLASPDCTLARQYPGRITGKYHIRLSGTSMAAPVVTGVVALLLERYPHLTPDQLKWLLMDAGRRYPGMPDAAKIVDAYKAMTAAGGQAPAANQGLLPNSGINPSDGTVLWGTSYWDTSYWDTSYWDTSYWDVATNYD